MVLVDPHELDSWRTYVTTSAYQRTAWLLDARLCRPSDTGLSRRQIAELDADHLLGMDRGQTRGWHRFSFKGLVYVGVVIQAKSLGLHHAQMAALRHAFVDTELIRPPASPGPSPDNIETYEGGFAINQVFKGENMLVLVDDVGSIIICEQSRLPEALDGYERPCVIIGLNATVSRALRALERVAEIEGHETEPLPPAAAIETRLATALESRLTPKEKKLLDIVRDGAYTEIRVTKKNGEPRLVYAKGIYQATEETRPDAILGLLAAKDFTDLSITKRDGQIVKYTQEDTYKL